MKVRLFLGVLLLLNLLSSCYSYKPNTLPDIEDTQFIKECVNAHNNFRSKVNPPASNMLHMVRRPSPSICNGNWIVLLN